MTHDELVENLEYPWVDETRVVPRADKYRLALLAVVELHKPSGIFCRGCGFNEEYNEPAQLLPCPTIQAIEKELS